MQIRRTLVGGAVLRVVKPERGRDHEPLAARAADAYAEEIRRHPDAIAAAAVDAVRRVKEAEEDIAVRHTAAQRDLARDAERLPEVHLLEAIAVVGHRLR